jgi:hypothetical protein
LALCAQGHFPKLIRLGPDSVGGDLADDGQEGVEQAVAVTSD